jgi:hypothetical protein
MIDTYDRVFVRLNAALMIALLVCIVRCSRDAADRRYIPGFLLIGVGVVILTVHQLHITPSEWAFAVKSIAVGIAIWGGVLVERLWKTRRSSNGRPS